MINVSEFVEKALLKNVLPISIYENFYKSFSILETHNDFSLFDIKPIKAKTGIRFYRMRKGKYRAIFHLEDNHIFIDLIGKREEVYNLWQQKQ